MNTSLEKSDPRSVPHRKLYTGAEIPAVGLGTFGSDRFTAAETAEAVLGAAAIGYRHFDCAAVYGNEKEIGISLQKVMSSGIRREELGITSKLWNAKHAEEDVFPACKQTLAWTRMEVQHLVTEVWTYLLERGTEGMDFPSRVYLCIAVYLMGSKRRLSQPGGDRSWFPRSGTARGKDQRPRLAQVILGECRREQGYRRAMGKAD